MTTSRPGDLSRFAPDVDSHDRLLRALCGVAAAIVQAASTGVRLPREESTGLFTAPGRRRCSPGRHQLDYELSLSPDGADRQAALALPLMFVAVDDEVEVTDGRRSRGAFSRSISRRRWEPGQQRFATTQRRACGY